MNNRSKGIFFILLSAFSFSLMNLFVKMAADVSSTQKSFFVYIVVAIVSTVTMKRKNVKFRWKKENTVPILLRAAAGTSAVVLHYYAVSHMNLADASILNKMSPFFVTFFCWAILKEEIRPPHILFMIIACAGSMLVVKPSFDFQAMLPAILAIAGAVGTGGGYAMVRVCTTRGENPDRVVWVYSVFTVTVLLPWVALHYQPMTPQQFGFLFLAGIGSVCGQLSVSYAYSFAESREISVFNYTNVVFAGLWSWMLWRQIPDAVSLAGYAVVFSGALLMFFYNRGLDKRKKA